MFGAGRTGVLQNNIQRDLEQHSSLRFIKDVHAKEM